MQYTIAEFRANLRKALDAVDRGELVVITRHDTDYIIITSSHWNDSQTAAARTGMTRLVTNDESSDIRPEKITAGASHQNKDDFVEAGKTIEIEEQVCCQATKPCKHWAFDELQQVWVNQLTGRKREVAT